MALKTRPFLELTRDAMFEALGEERPSAQVRGTMLQVWFQAFRQHYEVWLRPNAGLIELGLHFEGEREDNFRRIALVAEAMPLVVGELGPSVEVEEWTERWTRVHETLPLRTLDEVFARELGQRVARFAQVLEPLLRPLGPIVTAERESATTGDRWRRRRRQQTRG